MCVGGGGGGGGGKKEREEEREKECTFGPLLAVDHEPSEHHTVK